MTVNALRARTIQAVVTASGALVRGAHNPCDATSGSLTMTLPTGSTQGAYLSVEKTDASTNSVTISGSIRGSASTISLTYQRECLQLEADSTGSWWPISGHRTTNSLDAAYRSRVDAGNTTSRPTASTVGAGSLYFDTTRGALVASDGTNWQGDVTTLNARDYGAVGDGTTDDAAALNALFTAAGALPATARVRVFIPAGTYKINSTVTFPARAGLMIEGAGESATIINSNVPSATYPAIAYALQGATTYKSGLFQVSLTTDVVDGSRTVTVPTGLLAAGGAAVGDLITIDTTKADTDNPGSGYVLGAYRVIVGISGDVITVDEPWHTGYAVATDAPKISVRVTNTGIRIGKFTINVPKGGGGQALSVPSIVDGYVYQVTANGNGTNNEGATGQSFVGIGVEGVGVTVDSCTARDFYEPVNNSYGYGILLGGVTNGLVIRCRVERCKHGITSGNGTRRTFNNAYINNDAIDCIIEAHPSVYDVLIDGNRLLGTNTVPAGGITGSQIWARAHRTTISNNTLNARTVSGSIGASTASIKLLAYGGADNTIITGNRMTGATYGIKGDEINPAPSITGLTISDNLIEAGSIGVDLVSAGSFVAGGSFVHITNNSIRSGGYGIWSGPLSDSVVAGNTITYGNTTYGIGISIDGGTNTSYSGDRTTVSGNIVRYLAGGGADGSAIRLFNRLNNYQLVDNVTSSANAVGVKIDELDATYSTTVALANNTGDAKTIRRGGTTAPTSGTYRAGTIVWNNSPSVVTGSGASYVVTGWLCTVAGTPGTWTELRAPNTAVAGSSVFNVKDYGALGTGTSATQDTAAFQAAITAASASNGIIYCPTPPVAYTITSTLQTFKHMRLIGDGPARAADGGTEIRCGVVGPLFQMGTDNSQPYDSNYYDGPEGLYLSNIYVRGYTATSTMDNGASTYCAGTYGVRDWRGGSVVMEDVYFEGLDYWFWGVQSDMNTFTRVKVNHCHRGFYLGPRSDQATFYDLQVILSDKVGTIDCARGTTFYSPKLVDNGVFNTTTGVATVPITLTNTSTQGSTHDGTGMYSPWIEQGNSQIPITQALVEMGIGDSTTVRGLSIDDPKIVTGQNIFLTTAASAGATTLTLSNNPVTTYGVSTFTLGYGATQETVTITNGATGALSAPLTNAHGVNDVLWTASAPALLQYLVKTDNADGIYLNLRTQFQAGKLIRLIRNIGTFSPGAWIEHPFIGRVNAPYTNPAQNDSTGTCDPYLMSKSSGYPHIMRTGSGQTLARYARSTEASHRLEINNAGRILFGGGTTSPDIAVGRPTAGAVSVSDTNGTVGAAQVFRTGFGTTASRPTASTVGAGSMYFDTTLGCLVGSDGTTWKSGGPSGWNSVIDDGADPTGVTPTNFATTLAKGGVTYIPPGNYLINSVSLPSGAQLVGAGKDLVTLTFNSPTTQTFMTSTGSLGTSIALTANSPMGSTTVTVASTTGITVGGWCLIGDNTVPDANYSTRKAGELVRVSSFVSNTSITFQSPQAFGYTTANSAFIQPVVANANVKVSGIKMVNPVPGTTTAAGMAFTRCVGVRVEDCDFVGIDNPNLTIDTCAEFSVQRIFAKDAASDDANSRYGYGVLVQGGSTAGEVLNCRAENVRHGFSTGGEEAGYGETTDVLVANFHAIGCKLAGLDTHGGSSDVTFASCVVRGSQINTAPGIQIRGNRMTVVGCRTYDTVSSSVYMTQCQQARIIGNNFADASAIGITIDGDATGSIIKGNTISNYSTYGVFCSTNAAGSDIDIEDNHFKDYNTSVGYGVYLDGTLSFPRVMRNHCSNGWNGIFTTATPSRPLIEDNTGTNLNVGGAWCTKASASNAYLRRNRLENAQFTSSQFDSVTLTSNGAVNFDHGIADYHRVTLQANATSLQWANKTNIDERKIVYLEIVQDATGGRTVSFTGNITSYKWAGGVAPVLSTAPNARDFFVFAWDSANDTMVELSRSTTVLNSVVTKSGSTSARPTASAVGAGALYYDTTINRLVVSDATRWRTNSSYVDVRDYGATGDGTTDDTTAVQAAFTAAAGATAYLSAGTYCISSGLSLPANASLVLDPAATIKATASMSSMIATPTGTLSTDSSITGGGILDCNGLANNGLALGYFQQYRLEGLQVRNWLVYGFKIGDASTPITSYGLEALNIRAYRSTGTIPAGSACMILDSNSTDHQVTQFIGMGGDTGFIDNSGGSYLKNVHVWCRPSQGTMTTGFDIGGSSGVYVTCYADSPTTYGFRIRGSWNGSMVAPRVYNNSSGNDNVMVAFRMDTTAIGSIWGAVIGGADSSHRIATDYQSGGSLSTLTTLGTTRVNVVSPVFAETYNQSLRLNGSLQNWNDGTVDFGSQTGGRFRSIYHVGGLSTGLQTKTSSYSVTANDNVILANGSGITITLLSPASTWSGRTYTVKNIGTSIVTVASATGTVDITSVAPGAGYTYYADGTNWYTAHGNHTSQTTLYLSGSGNYTIPAWATFLDVEAVGGGAGAGAGMRGAAGTVRCGGGAGGNGQVVKRRLSVADILAAFPTGVVPYTVGAGGAGGAAQTVDSTAGANGTSGSQTWLGAAGGNVNNLVFCRGGTAGSGGTATAGASGASFFACDVTWPAMTNASATGGASAGANAGASSAGGGITSGNVAGNGAQGGSASVGGGTVGAGGVVDSTTPGTGAAGAIVTYWAVGAASGAASITQAAQAGANGLANTGVGGGGGGASVNGFNSGAGGNGGSGYLRITAYP